MITFGICSVTRTVSLCLSDGKRTLSRIDREVESFDHLVTLVQQLYSLAHVKPEQTDAYAVVTGPGAYAGIRSGISVVKSLASVYKKPVAGVNAMELLAYQQRQYKGLVVTVLESRRDEVNYGFFGTNPWNPIIACDTIKKDMLFKKLSEINGEYLLTGDLKMCPTDVEAHFIYSQPTADAAVLMADEKGLYNLTEVNPLYSYPVNVTTRSTKKGLDTKIFSK